jgi:Zn-dependent M16 (insulinase) family peptidase
VTRASGERLSYEEVTARLEEETVGFLAELGVTNGFFELIHVIIHAENEKYETIVRWLYDIIYGSEFDLQRSVIFSFLSFPSLSLHYNECESGV